MSEVLAVIKEHEGVGISVRRVALRAPGDFEVLVRPHACGICGSDLKTWEFQAYRQEYLRKSMPVIMGHEVAGEVLAIGRHVRNVAVGDRVLTDPVMRCGVCRLCEEGRTNICLDRRVLGYEMDGGMAELAVLPAACLIKIPASIDYLDAPLLEILGTAVHAIERTGLVTGQPCAIIGPGPLGLMLLQALRASGATPVAIYGTERSRPRLEIARRLGADLVDVTDPAVLARDANRYEHVFEVAGRPEALAAAGQLVRHGGNLVFASGFDRVPEEFRLNAMLKNREVNLITATGHPRQAWDRSLALVESGQVRIDGLVDLVVPLEEADRAFQAAWQRTALKAVIRCNPTTAWKNYADT